MQKAIAVLLSGLAFGLSGGSVYASKAERVQDNATKVFYAGEDSRVEELKKEINMDQEQA